MKTFIFTSLKLISLISLILFGLIANARDDYYETPDPENVIIDMTNLYILRQQLIRNQLERDGAVFESHIVERGESWKSLADMAGLDEEDLRYLNGDLKNLYAGMEITLVSFPKWSLNYERKIMAMHPASFTEAEKHMKDKKWKKATKSYSDIIKCSDCLTARYMRGMAYYNNGKYKEAAKDFSWVAGNDKFKLYDDASDLSHQANKAWEQKKAERAEFWGNLVGAVVETGLQVTSNIMAAKQMESYSSNYARVTSYPSGGSLAAQMEQPGYFQAVQNNLMNLSIQQVQQEQQREYMEMRNVYLQMGKDLTWNEFLAIKAEAYSMMKAEESGNSGGYNSGTVNYGTSNTSTHGQKECHLCRGTGICQTCNGSGVGRDNMFGTGKHYECPNCYLVNGKRTGKCSACHGTGTVYGKL